MKTRYLIIFFFLCSLLLFLPQNAIDAEPRAVTYTVNSDTDAPDAYLGDSICATVGGNCTLHAAIQNANQDGQASIIQFASQFQDTHAINDDALPILTEDNTTIDASNRWDGGDNRPGVEVECTICDDIIRINSSGNVIKGIFFGGGVSSGVKLINGNNNVIGGTGTGERNVFITGQFGVRFDSGLNNSIIGNYFGTVTGDTVPGIVAGDVGIFTQADGNTISDNLIVGYTGLSGTIYDPPAGIWLAYSDDNTVTDNVIGMDVYETSALGNEVGIMVYWSDGNTIGPYNLIEGNTSHGIQLYQTSNTTITENQVGHFWYGEGNGGDGINLHAVSGDTLIEDNGICYNDGNGLWLDFNDATIQGNLITNNGGDGIHLSGDNSQIGGVSADDRNVIGDNTGNGISLDGAVSATVENNYIGTQDQGVFDSGNGGHGILISNGAHDNVIGGASAGEGNVISYNSVYGISITGATTHNNEVYGNIIGAPLNWGWEAGNGQHGIGIYNSAHHNVIGANTAGSGNIILASGWSGVVIQNGTGNTIEGNYIGTNGGGIHWGNAYYGVVVEYTIGSAGEDNFINFNEIAYNGTHGGLDNVEAGVYINRSDGNMISRNSIHDNDGPGIKLVNSGNNNMPAPVITSASCEGTISGTAQANAWVQIFSDNADEGWVWEGTAQANGSGNWSWPGGVIGPHLTATARDNVTLDTSPFSAPYDVGICVGYFYLPLVIK